jgi:hypothetical protein
VSGSNLWQRGMRLGDSEFGTPTSATDGPRPKWFWWFVAVVVVAFSLGTVVNIAVEASFAPEQRALLLRSGGALGKVASTEYGSVQGRYWPAAIVHDIALGGTLVVPNLELVYPPRFELLADVDIRVENYDPVLTDAMYESLNGLPHARGVGNTVGSGGFKRIRIVWAEDGPPVPVLRIWFYENTTLLIDDRVTSPDAN